MKNDWHINNLPVFYPLIDAVSFAFQLKTDRNDFDYHIIFFFTVLKMSENTLNKYKDGNALILRCM